jgi:hypothetical protein
VEPRLEDVGAALLSSEDGVLHADESGGNASARDDLLDSRHDGYDIEE